jgi:hypothetical protein
MEPVPGDGPFDGATLSSHDRQILATLEQAFETNEGRGANGSWALFRLRVLLVWGAKATVASGLVMSMLGVAMICIGLISSIWLAVGGEGLLSAGTLLLARRAPILWQRRHTWRGVAPL